MKISWNWNETIESILAGEEVDISWNRLVSKANTEERVADLVRVLDYELQLKKDFLLDQLDEGEDLAVIEKQLEDAEQSYRIARSEFDILYFGYEYFSEDRNEGNESNAIPEGVSIEDAPHIHRELCFELHLVSNVKRNTRKAQSMPRGHAKTLWLSNVFPTHQAVFKKRRFILIVSETESMSRKFVEFIAETLKHNAKLRADFGELLSTGAVGTRKNFKDNVEAFETFNGVYVQSASISKQLRGARYKQFRPDLVICDK